MELINREYNIAPNLPILRCFVVRNENVLWVKAIDIVEYFFPGNNHPSRIVKNIVPENMKRSWETLKGAFSSDMHAICPSNTIFISEPGLYKLVFRSKREEAFAFSNWICETMLPSLRQTGHFSVVENSRELNSAKIEAIQAKQEAEQAKLEAEQTKVELESIRKNADDAYIRAEKYLQRYNTVAEDVISKPLQSDLLQSLVVHQTFENKMKLIFTRCQRRTLETSLRRLTRKYPEALEIYRNDYVAHSILIVHCLKEELKKKRIRFISRYNTITFVNDDMNSDDVIDIIQDIITTANYRI